MSLHLARRISKAGNGKWPVSFPDLLQIRRGILRLLMTSSLPLPLPSSPYLLLSEDAIGDAPAGNGDKIVNFNLYDPKMQKQVTMVEQRIPRSIHRSRNIGSSRGWMIRIHEEDLTVHLTNMFNPSAPESTHKVISLPVLLPRPDLSQPMATLEIRNVSLSSSPDNLDEEDCILAVKYFGNITSFCRIGDSQWRDHVCLTRRFEESLVVYSNKDSTFYLTPSTNSFFRKDARGMSKPWFPFLTYYRQLGPLKHPKMGEYEYELLRRCTRTKHLVESPSGDFFILVNYALNTCKGKPVFPWETKDLDPVEVKTGTKWFFLYSHDSTFTVQDIGDLCIFLGGDNEPFCLSTTMYPGLEPNSIYFTERNQVYLYNIADQTTSQLPDLDGPISPIWLQPILHK